MSSAAAGKRMLLEGVAEQVEEPLGSRRAFFAGIKRSPVGILAWRWEGLLTEPRRCATHRFTVCFACWTPVLRILCLTSTRSLSTLQAVPDEEPVPHAAFPPPGAATSLRHCRVLPEAFHRNALLYFLLPGGRLSTLRCSHLHTLVVSQ